MTTGFADQIRELPDDRLAALLRLRPDLVVPVPADLSALAARAQARVSVARALDTLDRLAAGPPIGSTTTGATADPDSAVGWLVERRLLVPTSETTVELPREVGLLLRRDDGPFGPLHPRPPEPEAPQRPLDAVDSAGAGQAMEVVRHTEELLDALSLEPAPVLKAGGLGVRDLRRLARLTGLAD